MRTFTSINYFMYELPSPRFRMMSYVLTTQKIELATGQISTTRISFRGHKKPEPPQDRFP